MAFTDTELAGAIKNFLVTSQLMTQQQRDALLEDPTEINVGERLSASQLACFNTYWQELGTWIADHGGDIAMTSGKNVPGRQGGNPTGLSLTAIYNDAFNDVNKNIGKEGWKPKKAVANQLRFASFFE